MSVPESRQIISVQGLPPGRDYLVSTIGVSADAGVNFTKDEIFSGQGYDQPDLNCDLTATPAANLEVNMFSLTNPMPNLGEYFLSSGASFANLPGPFAINTSGWSNWGNNDPTALNEIVTSWFLNEEESGVDSMILYCQGSFLLEDGILNHEIEIRFYPNRANAILEARGLI
mgnify:CR=1 FL=1|tara:strand:+ start:2014 stop:2529 length:516 start_codon:yes stop_codon:yes gene_type:complete